MRNRKCTKPKRLLSFFLAVLVAVSILPMSWLQASAANRKTPGCSNHNRNRWKWKSAG